MNKAALVLSAIAVSALSLNANAGPVEQYGRLYADGNKIVGEKSGGAAVQLKGPSLQWSVTGWGSDRFFLTETVEAMVNGWGAQVIRAPLGIAYSFSPDDEVKDGYNVTPEANWGRVERVVDATVSSGIYAILDWHSHTAHEEGEIALAIDFFTSADRGGKYGNSPAVIFEIYNEPTDAASWADVKKSSEAVIKAIRDARFNNLILVGSPHWDTDLDIAAADPPSDPLNNIAFTFHFYADDHKIDGSHWPRSSKTHRDILNDAMSLGFPVFVSEWGTNDASTGGNLNFAEADKWHAYLDQNKISSVAWGAMAGDGNVLYFWGRDGNPLTLGSSTLANWTNPAGMTAHGRYVYRWLTGRDTTHTGEITPPGYPTYIGERTPIVLSTSAMSIETADSSGSDASMVVEDGIMKATFELKRGTYKWDPYVTAYYDVGGLSECKCGIGYTYRGSPHSLRIEQSDVTDYAFHQTRYTRQTEEWTEAVILWKDFIQPDWSEEDPVPVNPGTVTAISWYVEDKAGTTGEFWVKDVYCLLDDGAVSIKPSLRPQGSSNAAASYLKASGGMIQLRLPQAGRVDVFNLKGKRVRTVKLKAGDHAVRVDGFKLPKGVYVVKASSVGGEGWKQSVKVLIK